MEVTVYHFRIVCLKSDGDIYVINTTPKRPCFEIFHIFIHFTFYMIVHVLYSSEMNTSDLEMSAAFRNAFHVVEFNFLDLTFL